MYAKVFRALWDGTLADSWEGWTVFVFLLAHADAEGYVDMTPQAIARRSSLPLEAVRRGLEVLEAPDPESRSPEEDGRRIVRMDEARPWGWRVVNARYYRGLTDAEMVRESARVRQADRRRRRREEGFVPHPNGCPWDPVQPDVLYLGCIECAKLAERHTVSHAVTPGHAGSRQAEAEAEAEAESTPTSLRSVGASEPVPVGDSVEASGGDGSSASGLAAGPSSPAGGLSGPEVGSEPGGVEIVAPERSCSPERSADPEADILSAFRGDVLRAGAMLIDMKARGLSIPTNRPGIEWVPTEAMLAEWKSAFPGVDVEAQIRAMRTWSLTHPVQRKTLRGMPAFVNRWLSTEQDKASRGGGSGHGVRGRSLRGPTDARYLEQNRGVVAGNGGSDG